MVRSDYHIILASNSPRRQELLGGLDLDFEVRVLPNIEEDYPDDLDTKDIPVYIATEKAIAYKMKYDAIKRTGGRKKGSQNDHPLKGVKTIQIIGKDFGDSPKQVQRYLKIAELIPELLEKLDDGTISFNPAFEIAFLSNEE